MKSRASLAVCLVAACVCTARAAEQGTLVLDESAYWRYYVQFGIDRLTPDALQKEGPALFGKRGMARLKQQVKRWHSPPYAERAIDLSKVDWRGHAVFFVTQVANVGCNDERITFHTRTPAPPPGWFRPDFDDRPWTRRRLPLLVGNIPARGIGHGVGEMRQPLARRAVFRTTFDVADPAKPYTLRLVFRGAAQVWINGERLRFGTAASRKFGPEDPAPPYPKEAYICLDGEYPAYWAERTKRRIGKTGFVPYCPDLVGDADRAFAAIRRHTRKKFGGDYYRGIVTRKGWDRITRLRNRTLGPAAIPPRLLHKGRNVLAIEIRAADLHPIVAASKGMDWGRNYVMGANFTWAHCRLLKARLSCTDPAAPSALKRPAGVHVWAEDVHRRLHVGDFGRGSAGAARIVGAANGTYAAQIAVSTNQELTGLKATPSALRSADGAEIPASVVRVQYLVPHPASAMVSLGQWRGLPEIVKYTVCTTSWMSLLRYGPAAARKNPPRSAEAQKLLERLFFFDHISSRPPRRVPADRCQPVWLSLRVPADAKAGVYRGAVRVKADGMKPVSVPVEAEIVGWQVPGPRHFQSVFAGEQSPYGVARQYNVPLWSDRHFTRMEASFRELGRLGSRWIFVPVIHVTEFGNLKDSMVRWTREADGRLSFDFGLLDRYLDLAVKHLGRNIVVCFVVAHGTHAGAPASVTVLDKKTGKAETLDLSKKSPHYEKHWHRFGAAVYEHMRSRGLHESLHWGYGWDGIGDADLIPVLAKAVPEAVRWARGSHAPNRAPGGWAGAFTASSFIYGVPITENSRHGWRRKDLWMVNPRAGCSVISANGHSPPFAYRMLMNRALVTGCRGIARIGADYWAGTFYLGYKGRAWAGSLPGMGCVGFFWPGPDGAESSQRAEMFLEGIQETEARIYVEQALERGSLPKDLAGRVRDALTRHHRETLYVPVGRIGVQIQEYCAGWQERAGRLYRAAAEVARTVPFDLDPASMTRQFPARSTGRIELTLRNWTTRPRRWRASSDKPWLTPERAAGTLTGHGTLVARVDTRSLKPGQTGEATLTVTDVTSGRAHPVKVAVKAGKVFEFVVGKAYDYLGRPGHAASFGPKHIGDVATYNVPVGERESREFVFVNHSGAGLKYRIESPVKWMRAMPGAGTLQPRQRTRVTVTAAPPDRAAARHDVQLTIREVGTSLAQTAKMVVHVMPPYRAPAEPKGTPVHLAGLPKTMVTQHKSRAYWYGTSDKGRADYGPKFDEKKNILGGTPQLTAYNIAGKGYAAFSATVQMSPHRRKVGESAADKIVNFEVHVDGVLRAQSGLMTPKDEARLLVVDDLHNAKELKLLVRWDRPEPKYLGGTVGTVWLEPKVYLGN